MTLDSSTQLAVVRLVCTRRQRTDDVLPAGPVRRPRQTDNDVPGDHSTERTMPVPRPGRERRSGTFPCLAGQRSRLPVSTGLTDRQWVTNTGCRCHAVLIKPQLADRMDRK